MRITCILGLSVLLMGATDAGPLHAQTAAAASVAALDSVARQIVAAARYATFATVDAKGQPQLRTVQPVAPDGSWRVWFATNPRTRKVKEIERQPLVALHYFDTTTDSYIAIAGRARVVRDRATKDAHWDPAWDAFYRNRDTDVVLIVVEPSRVEVVSPRRGVDSNKDTWLPQSFVPRRGAH